MKKSESFIYEDILMDIYKDIKYQGLSIEITLSASRELVRHDKNIQFVIKILEEGYECSASKRKKGIIEKCLRQGNKEYKAVLVEIDNGTRENIWRLIHFGKKTFKRRRK